MLERDTSSGSGRYAALGASRSAAANPGCPAHYEVPYDTERDNYHEHRIAYHSELVIIEISTVREITHQGPPERRDQVGTGRPSSSPIGQQHEPAGGPPRRLSISRSRPSAWLSDGSPDRPPSATRAEPGVINSAGGRERSRRHQQCQRLQGDDAVSAPLGKWSLEATVLRWYPGHCPAPSGVSTGAHGALFRGPEVLGARGCAAAIGGRLGVEVLLDQFGDSAERGLVVGGDGHLRAVTGAQRHDHQR